MFGDPDICCGAGMIHALLPFALIPGKKKENGKEAESNPREEASKPESVIEDYKREWQDSDFFVEIYSAEGRLLWMNDKAARKWKTWR